MIEQPVRPLVTFAVFAYNQEDMIKDAIEGAFAQTYEPLEIILSDDCSSDDTIGVMREMAKSYAGPHKVIVRQSPENKGLMEHINAVAAVATGDVIIAAAGDDISGSNRTSRLMEVYQKDSRIMAVYSDFAKLEGGKTTCREGGLLRHIRTGEIAYDGGGIGRGAAYSYRRQCFTWPERLNPRVFSEDRVLPMRAGMLGKVCFLDEELIFYREVETSLTNKLREAGKLAMDDPVHLQIVGAEITKAFDLGDIPRGQFIYLKLCMKMRAVVRHLLGQSGYAGAGAVRAIGRLINRSARRVLFRRRVMTQDNTQ